MAARSSISVSQIAPKIEYSACLPVPHSLITYTHAHEMNLGRYERAYADGRLHKAYNMYQLSSVYVSKKMLLLVCVFHYAFTHQTVTKERSSVIKGVDGERERERERKREREREREDQMSNLHKPVMEA